MKRKNGTKNNNFEYSYFLRNAMIDMFLPPNVQGTCQVSENLAGL